MAPVVRLHRLVWGGRLFDNEQWSCSLHFGSPDTSSAVASDYVPALIAWMGRADSKLSNRAHMDEIKLNIINPVTGRYLFPVSNTHLQLDAGVGTGSVGPGQLSCAVSTRTAIDRGRAHAGRFYPPNADLNSFLGSDGRLTAPTALAMATSAATLITALNAVDPELTAVVFSKIGQTVEPITHVRVGRVIDTMRSRRASLDESPETAVVT